MAEQRDSQARSQLRSLRTSLSDMSAGVSAAKFGVYSYEQRSGIPRSKIAAALQRAVDEASAAGMRLDLPPGTIKIDRPIVSKGIAHRLRGAAGLTVLQTGDSTYSALTLGPGAAGSGLMSSGYVEDLIIEGPTERPTTLSAGLTLDGLRYFTVQGVTVRNMDVGFDLLNNSYGSEFYKCKTLFGTTNVGIRLRGQQPDGTWGSGSDIGFFNNWFQGNIAGVWIEKDGGGYHFVRGQINCGHNLTEDTDIAGAVVLGANYADKTNASLYGDAGNVSIFGVDMEGFKRSYMLRSFGRVNLQAYSNSFLATSKDQPAMGILKATGAENGSVMFLGNTCKGTYSSDLISVTGQGSAYYYAEEGTIMQATVKGASITPGATMASQSNVALGAGFNRVGGLPTMMLARSRVRQATNGSPKFEVSVNSGATYDYAIVTTKYGSAAPSVAPDFVGQVYVDTTNKQSYMALGTAITDWKQITN